MPTDGDAQRGRRRFRRLLELAVAMLILLTAGGLLLVAVGRTREAARRTQCLNNIRAIAMGLQSYADGNQRFPGATCPSLLASPDRRLSWFITIDPYLEARMDPTWKPQPNEPWDSPANLDLARRPLWMIACPAERRPRNPEGLPLTNYVGATGVGADAITLPKGDPRAGVFGFDRETAPAEITDGPANTVLVIETASDPGPWLAAGRSTSRPFLPDEPPAIGRGGQFGGLHRGGANVAFADGSVRFVRDSVDPEVFAALFTIAGGDDPTPLPAD